MKRSMKQVSSEHNNKGPPRPLPQTRNTRTSTNIFYLCCSDNYQTRFGQEASAALLLCSDNADKDEIDIFILEKYSTVSKQDTWI
jgi:hypothetical protein